MEALSKSDNFILVFANINIGENEASYVLGFKVQVDSTKKNKDGCNQ